MRALVVVPTYEEAANITRLLESVREHVPDAHVLVVDDNSPDGTAEVADRSAERLERIHVLRRPRKAGLGSAYRRGFRWGIDRGFDVLVEMDADLSHDPSQLPALLSAVELGADLAIGSRYVEGGSIPAWSAGRRALSKWGNRYAALALDLRVADATSGFRAYRADALTEIRFERVRADGYGFQIETAYRMSRAGRKVVEVPIDFSERSDGRSKLSRRIVVEALVLVTAWGIRDRVFRGRRPRGTPASSR